MSFTSYTPPSVDLLERAVFRTLLQFRDSPVLQAVLAALVSEVALLLDAVAEVVKLRGPADAGGMELDALGRIVGQPRELVDFAAIAWFETDTARRGADSVPVWVQNAPLGEMLLADDSQFRQLIEAATDRNHADYGSVPEIQAVVQRAFGVLCSIEIVGPSTIRIIVEDRTSDNVVALLERHGDTTEVDDKYFLPIPATVFVSEVVRAI